MGLLKEFKSFAVKGDMINLAVGIIIGAAFNDIVKSIVNDIVMPLINPLIPGGKWKELTIGPDIKIGNFMSVVLSFLIVAWIVFLITKAINNFKKKEEAKPAAPIKSEVLLEEIRDLLKK